MLGKEGQLVGFIELDASGNINDATGYVDCTYILPAYQGQGICRKLYQVLEAHAKERHIKRLDVHASHVARPIFNKFGFTLIERQEVLRNGVKLERFYMSKDLSDVA